MGNHRGGVHLCIPAGADGRDEDLRNEYGGSPSPARRLSISSCTAWLWPTRSSKMWSVRNVDTIYSQVWYDLSEEPMVYVLPETDRFCKVQVLDAWTNTAAVLDRAGAYAITRATWSGDLPEDVARIDVPTAMAWSITRTVLSGESGSSECVCHSGGNETYAAFRLPERRERISPRRGVIRKKTTMSLSIRFFLWIQPRSSARQMR